MNNNPHISRRVFLKGATACSFGIPYLISSEAFGANDQITSGVIGVGGPARAAGGMWTFSEGSEMGRQKRSEYWMKATSTPA